MIRTLEGRINAWNQGAMELYGWREEEAVGRISHDLLKTQFPRPLEEIESELVRNGQWQGNLVHTTRDGGRVVVQSQWALNLNEPAGAVVEINRPATGKDFNSKSLIDASGILSKIAAMVLGGGAIVCLLIFTYYLYHYAWTGERAFNSSISEVLYYGVPLVLAVFLFASLGFKASYKINLALLCVSLVASVFGLELCLDLLGAIKVRKPVMATLADSRDKLKVAADLAKKFGVTIDPRSAGEVLADLRKRGIDAVPIITANNNLFIEQPDGSNKSAINIHGQEMVPLAAVSNKVTLLCNEDGQWIDYRSDQHGFNNPNSVWQSSRVEIAALGDSFVHGYCVPPDKNFVALIRQRYPATLNLGIAGDGPLTMLATLKEYLPPYAPKIVLWFYYEGNDLTDLQSERKSAVLRNYLKDDFTQSEIAQQSDIDRAIIEDLPRQEAMQRANSERKLRNIDNKFDKFFTLLKLGVIRQRLGLGGLTIADVAKLADLQGPNMDTFREILFQAKRRVDSWGGKIYFVYLPEWARYSEPSTWGVKSYSRVLHLVRDAGIPIVDINTVFHSHGDPLSLFPFREVGHYNEAGHRLVAEAVLRSLPSSNGSSLK
ncbi:MAG: hypothetical protein ACM3SP_20940 [Chloroflexota bacterium]